MPSDAERLYAIPLPATRTGALYNAFSYPTKISPETVGLFIATHTEPGETVLDVFAGSGSTGIGALLCERPTDAMKKMARDFGLRPSWGPRRAALYDIGVLGSFIARVMCGPPDPKRFSQAAERLVDSAEKRTGWLYQAEDPDGVAGTIRHTIYSDVLECPSCGEQTTYWAAAVREDPAFFASEFACAGCGETVRVDRCSRVTENAYDAVLGRTIERKRRVPVVVYGKSEGRNWRREVDQADRAVIEKSAAADLPASAPVVEVSLGDLYRAGYHRGITHLHHFYTQRNFLAIATMWDLVDDFDADLRDSLRLLVLSFNAAHSTLMTRAVAKKKQRSLVLTGAQSGVLYVSGLPVEKNVFEGVRRKARVIAAAFALTYGTEGTATVRQASSTSLELDDDSVDYVFTDPPFGDYIPYAEVNQINELWLGSATDRSSEIVVSAHQERGVADYEQMMTRVFCEVARVLKPEALATVVFHSAKAAVWSALIDAYTSSGLAVRGTSVLNKTQGSFKQVVSSTTVKGDVLILLGKAADTENLGRPASIDEVIEAVLQNAETNVAEDERSPERLFSRFVTRCLAENLPVSIDVSEFYLRAGLEGVV